MKQIGSFHIFCVLPLFLFYLQLLYLGVSDMITVQCTHLFSYHNLTLILIAVSMTSQSFSVPVADSVLQS